MTKNKIQTFKTKKLNKLKIALSNVNGFEYFKNYTASKKF